MFGIFKKKKPSEKLQNRYEQLLKEAFELSKSNRSQSDQKNSEANDLLKEIERLRSKGE